VQQVNEGNAPGALRRTRNDGQEDVCKESSTRGCAAGRCFVVYLSLRPPHSPAAPVHESVGLRG